MVVAQYLLTFREVLEAALLAAIILAFLNRTGRANLTRYAGYGIAGATAASVAIGASVIAVYGALDDAAGQLFEGTAAVIAVAVLTSMIYWMAVKGRRIKSEVEGRVESAVTKGTVVGIMSLTFVLVFREGLETVLFLTPYLGLDAFGTALGAILGMAFGIGLAYAVFRVGLKLNLRKFFYLTSILLVLVAAGLLGYGVHELIEYGEGTGAYDLGWWASPAYNLGLADTDPLHNKGLIGSIFAVMFGYDTDPEWARVVAHAAYLAITMPLVVLVYRRPDVVAQWIRRLRGVFRTRAEKVASAPGR
jgi:high-affinity iron transporter